MTKLFEEAVALVATLPEEEQNRAAEVLTALASDHRPYTFSKEQIEGIEDAMKQADRGQYATGERVRAIFGRDL